MGLSWGKIEEFCVILGIKLWDKIMIKGFVDITEERIQIFEGILLIQQEEYYISVFVPVPYCLDDYGFVVGPEVRQVDSSSSILLSQDCFGYSRFLDRKSVV